MFRSQMDPSSARPLLHNELPSFSRLYDIARSIKSEHYGLVVKQHNVDAFSSSFGGPHADLISQTVDKRLRQMGGRLNEHLRAESPMFEYTIDLERPSLTGEETVCLDGSIPFWVVRNLSSIGKMVVAFIQQMPIESAQVLDCLGMMSRLVSSASLDADNAGHKITHRERECLWWCANGKTSEEIAIITGLAANTVNHYIANAAQKLNAVNRLHAVAIAMKTGLLNGDPAENL